MNHFRFGMGWLPDMPDFRDYTSEHTFIEPQIKRIKFSRTKQPTKVDLREWCSSIEDQGELGSCTAHAGIGLLEYFERRAFGNYVDASRLFLYKTTRNLMKTKGDMGANLRTTMHALTLFGAPPEDYWPYRITDFDKEPTSFCYAFAQNFQAIQYYRLDPPNTTKPALLDQIKSNLAAGLPAMFGFTVYSSIESAATTGAIPFPNKGEKVVGGHAIIAVGYDDSKRIFITKRHATQGAFLIRNSWGKSWGEQGYGWLPYEYVVSGLAVDWWTLVKSEWIDAGVFG